MDQHTFRAMNWFLKEVRPEWESRQAPRNFPDLMTYTEFFNILHTAWQSRDDRPTRSDLDKALMGFGQALNMVSRRGTPIASTDWRRLRQVTDAERIGRVRKPAKCPTCGHSPVASILCGRPAFSKELEADLEAGRVTLGGCCVSDDDPAWECGKCGAVIYRERR